jgi:hypothetical protein
MTANNLFYRNQYCAFAGQKNNDQENRRQLQPDLPPTLPFMLMFDAIPTLIPDGKRGVFTFTLNFHGGSLFQT